ncbi:DsrE family protein [Desulfohalovibrio reitneri]|uniref:DsrE family protein n=1 Tax=Desulfohalovibrio reitneri TaxID=1307759 RepID=UPI0004A7086B|nr:DsrE family protein [Desulfohalovibrio reitneri]
MNDEGKLCVVWSTADREVAERLVLLYVTNGLRKQWWKRVRLMIWGPSQELLCVDRRLRDGLAEAQEAGVECMACRNCSDHYGLTGQLRDLGVEVLYTGQPLSEMLQSDWKVLTF